MIVKRGSPVLLAILVAFGVGCSGTSPEDVVRFTAEETLQAQKDGQALLVDIRPIGSFSATHITGAISLPEDELDSRMGELPQDKRIVTYCACPQESSSARVAAKLMDKGYKNVGALLGGIAHWIELGYPVTLGNKTADALPSRPCGDVPSAALPQALSH